MLEGENMAQDEDEIDNSEDDADDSPTASSAIDSSDDSDDSDSSPSSMDPMVRQHLLQVAQKQANNNSLWTGLGRAAATLSTGLAGSNQPVNQQPFDAMESADQAPVQNVMNQQKNLSDSLKIQDQMAEAAKTQAAADPDSPQSIAAKNLIKRLYPGKFDDATLDKMSANDIGDSIMKPLELDQKVKAAQQAHSDKIADRMQGANDRQAAKADADHEKYVQHIEDSESKWRSDPASTRFDSMLSAATTGKAMIDKYRGREDDMPIQDIHALVSDRLKAITGATPTEQEISAQMPNTLKTRYAGAKSFLTGSPEGAGAGDFVKNIDSSFQEMEKTARQGLQNRQATVASSPRLSQDERDRLVQIGVPQPAYGQKSGSGGGTQNAGNYSPDVLQYAQTHKITPDQAQSIKQQRTGGQSPASSVAGSQPPAQQPQSVPSYLQPNPPGFAYGGVVGGLPSSNYAAAQAARMPHAPHLQLHAPRGYAGGGQIPGTPQVPYDNPINDTSIIKASPGEVMLPLHVTQAKDPALASYLYMKRLHGKVQ